MPSASQTAAAATGCCLAGALAWLVVSEFPVADPGRPSTRADPVRILEAAMPAIGDFTEFHVNDENPFIPYQLRIAEKTAKSEPRGTGVKPGPVPIPEPGKPVLPRLPGPGADGPTVNGIVVAASGPTVIATFSGKAASTLMKPGDTAEGWTLVEVIGDNVARMRQDASGTVINLVVPEGTAPPPRKADDAKHDPKADAQARAVGGKGPDGGASAPAGKSRKDKGAGRPHAGAPPDEAPSLPPGVQPPSDKTDRPSKTAPPSPPPPVRDDKVM